MWMVAPDQRRARLCQPDSDLFLERRRARLVLRSPMDRNDHYRPRLVRRADGSPGAPEVELARGVERQEGQPDAVDLAVGRLGSGAGETQTSFPERGLGIQQPL